MNKTTKGDFYKRLPWVIFYLFTIAFFVTVFPFMFGVGKVKYPSSEAFDGGTIGVKLASANKNKLTYVVEVTNTIKADDQTATDLVKYNLSVNPRSSINKEVKIDNFGLGVWRVSVPVSKAQTNVIFDLKRSDYVTEEVKQGCLAFSLTKKQLQYVSTDTIPDNTLLAMGRINSVLSTVNLGDDTESENAVETIKQLTQYNQELNQRLTSDNTLTESEIAKIKEKINSNTLQIKQLQEQTE